MVYPKRTRKLVMSREQAGIWVTPDFPEQSWDILDKSPVCMVVQNIIAKSVGALRLARVSQIDYGAMQFYRYTLSCQNYPSFFVYGDAEDKVAKIRSTHVALKMSKKYRDTRYEVEHVGDKASVKLGKSAAIRYILSNPTNSLLTFRKRVMDFPAKLSSFSSFGLRSPHMADVELDVDTVMELGRVIFGAKRLTDMTQSARDKLKSKTEEIARIQVSVLAADKKTVEVFNGDVWIVAALPDTGYGVVCVNYTMLGRDVQDVNYVKPLVFVENLTDLPDEYRPALFKLKMLKAHRGSAANIKDDHVDEDCLIPLSDSAFPDMNAASYCWSSLSIVSPMFVYLGA